ncbi:DUF1565 domain-containing protein [Aliifodinibius sp. S!AR15-10]|uniref:DUF1565 domain-containing protein n=1 Tax=Aliifodinibius sp. S!AR15-10 TaxID=2950437 RepID=UPI002865FC2A|nr:DUF1565 domain-containing protein [Aliifodinibius sp. S!AR15-10]MDR8391771.1 DUF1565 domain-containing protein [Aliifodinibius sp. S!AR15-10]
MIRKVTILCLAIFTIVLFSCSENSTGTGGADTGSGDNGDDTGTPSVTADAGSDQDAVVGFEVTADGSGSTGSGTVSYSWSISSKPTDSQATLSESASESPTLIPDLPGEYVLSLEASSDGESDTADVTVSAIAERLFVDANNGADGNTDGYMENTPLKTITRALEIYGENENDPFLDIDTLIVAEGTYDQGNGEKFPLNFYGDLIVKGDPNVDRKNIHILSPDVDREPTIELGEGVTLRHLHIENGYTGGSYNGDPDAVYVWGGSSAESSYAILEDVTLSTNNENGYIITTGSTINVEVRGYEGSRSTIDGKGIGHAWTNRFNTSDARLDVRDTDVINIGHDAAFELEDASNVNLFITNSTISPAATSSQNNAAIELNGDGNITLDNTTITSSDGTEAGTRFKYGIDMDSDQPSANIDVLNSTLQYTLWSAIEMYQATVKVNDSVIEGVHTQSTGDPNLARDGIKYLDGTLIVRGTTFRNMNTNAIDIGGPLTPNENDFFVELGTEGNPGNNVFEDIAALDVSVTRDDNLGDSDGVQDEIEAIGNSWSNGASPRCATAFDEYSQAEIWVNSQGGSLRWGTGSGAACN